MTRLIARKRISIFMSAAVVAAFGCAGGGGGQDITPQVADVTTPEDATVVPDTLVTDLVAADPGPGEAVFFQCSKPSDCEGLEHPMCEGYWECDKGKCSWVCGAQCAGEGESVAIVPGAPECCPGLTKIPCDEPDEQGVCYMCVGASVCTYCGNGECGKGENACNCPQDCAGECIEEGGSIPFVPGAPDCCPGLTKIPCDAPNEEGVCETCGGGPLCTYCGNGECGKGENPCNCPDDCGGAQCAGEGESVPVIPGAPECCPGLTKIPCDAPDEQGVCQMCVGASVCTYCGNGECGKGENACNCPQDCAGECIEEGGSIPFVPGAPECCPGLVEIPCDAPNDEGVCETCVGGALCTYCGNGECGKGENPCNCPQDCGGAQCAGEGESVPIIPGAPECCPGLTKVPCDAPDEQGVCQMCLGASVCTYCGNGECGKGENACNCPQDCAGECIDEGGSIPFVPGAPDCCPGLTKIPCDAPNDEGVCETCVGGPLCTYCGNGECGKGENPCNCPQDCGGAQCVGEGESVPVVPGAPECCPGLVKISCTTPDQQGGCMPCVGAMICAYCGNGECGKGENPCNCPEDCGGAQCVGEGESVPVIPNAPDCCPGLTKIPCDAPDEQGVCQVCLGAWLCTYCGNGECGKGENFCNCPMDCGFGQCIKEGEFVPGFPGAPPCCPGLVKIPCDAPDKQGVCQKCDWGWVCTYCGDGKCGKGENFCNCPEDCIEGVEPMEPSPTPK